MKKILKKSKKLCKAKTDGFSLLEISIVLLIVGIIAGSALKGMDMVEKAQIGSVANEISKLQIAYANYVNSYGILPGDDNNATERTGAPLNGDGDGKISGEDAKKILPHLYYAGLIDYNSSKKLKIGGEIDFVSENNRPKIRISLNGNGVLSKKQIVSLKAKIQDYLGEDSEKLEISPSLAESTHYTGKYLVKVRID